jgi:glucosamine-6-phosphate deaminase
MREFFCGRMKVLAADSTLQMAAKAAADFAAGARGLLEKHREINVVFSGAESQTLFHRALRERNDVEWDRINAFSVDEFYAPRMPAEYAVSAQPTRDLYSHVAMKSVNLINYAPEVVEEERRRYEALIDSHPPHISCLGIGISGHIALNEPGETDFNDIRRVRFVRVVEESKRQLKQDPNFQALDAIPDSGFTITLPTLMLAQVVLVLVPYALKAAVVARLMTAHVSPSFPASILLNKNEATLYLDPESARDIPVLKGLE